MTLTVTKQWNDNIFGQKCQGAVVASSASALIERDEKCYSITWNAPRNCSFDLEATHCGRSLRYICEAQGENA